MATLQATRNPTGRIDAGDAVIDAAETTDTAPIKSRFGKFVKVHGSYVAGEAAVRAAYAKQRDGEQLLGGRLAEQDAAIDQLARIESQQVVCIHSLAVESWLERLGADATWGLEDDTARTRVLGVLPRTPDRRRRAADNPPAKDEPKGEAPATEAGKSDAAPAETPK